MEKAEIRKIYLKKKAHFTATEVQSLSKKIFENFISGFDLKENQKVHCFLSIQEKLEVDTSFFLNYFFENKIRVFVPKIVKGKLVSIEVNKETPLIANSWGIKEPVENEDCGVRDFDFIITPLLYADPLGNRVGYGKGFYDLFFSEINPKSTKIGVSYFSPNEKVEDVSEFDVPLNYLVTPKDVVSFVDFESKLTK